VKEETIEAKYRDGVLTITMPKIEEAKARKIEVET
jgi:HSP20 family molecular chaperone IbpA